MKIKPKNYRELNCKVCGRFIAYVKGYACDVIYDCEVCGARTNQRFRFFNSSNVIEKMVKLYSIQELKTQERG